MANQNGHTVEPKAASGAAMRAARREVYPVPLLTGEIVLMKPLDLGAMARAGNIPDLLLPAVHRALFGDIGEKDDGERAEQILDTLKLVALVLPAAVHAPRIVDSPQADDEIALSDIDWADQYFLFSQAVQGVHALRKFRSGQTADMAAGSDGETLRGASEPPAGPG